MLTLPPREWPSDIGPSPEARGLRCYEVDLAILRSEREPAISR
jgi:hypothetical protein